MSEHFKNVRLDPSDSKVLFNLWVRLCMWGKGLKIHLQIDMVAVQPHACGEKAKNLYSNFTYYVSLELFLKI
ncbi:hypothetical protein FFZ96_00720 [Leptospira borgpetersenii]|nr:hypothetical protein LBHB_02525 [Leptospira borgpetersenii serovar Hardjo]TQE59281.1 hypothetical protein FFZ96_00720 [Leptospira borgpetersenii]